MTSVPSRRIWQLTAVVAVIVVGAILAVGLAMRGPPATDQASGSGELVVRVPALPLIGGDLATDTLTDRLVYSGIYRFGDRYRTQPDLAEGPCVPGVDLLTLSCRLRAATFHDGTPLTADDVAFSYSIALSPTCRSALFCIDGSGVERVETPDERTVVFVLREPDPAFDSLLAIVSIESRAVTEAAFRVLERTAASADRRAAVQLANEMKVELARESPQCERDLREAERLLGAAGVV